MLSVFRIDMKKPGANERAKEEDVFNMFDRIL